MLEKLITNGFGVIDKDASARKIITSIAKEFQFMDISQIECFTRTHGRPKPFYRRMTMEELNEYYKEQERKNIALIDCWGKALIFAFWISVGGGMWWLMYRGFVCWFYGH